MGKLPSVAVVHVGNGISSVWKVYPSSILLLQARIDLKGQTYTKIKLNWNIWKVSTVPFNISSKSFMSKSGSYKMEPPKYSIAPGLYYVQFTVQGVKGKTQTIESKEGGFLEMMSSPLVAVISGGSVVHVNPHKAMNRSAGLSYDPDLAPGSSQDLNFTWYCRNSTEKTVIQSCFENILSSKATGKEISLNSELLKPHTTFDLVLSVQKGSRINKAIQQIYVAEEANSHLEIRYVILHKRRDLS